MDHRAASFQFLRTTGLIPVKVRPNQKDPFSDWDPRATKSPEYVSTVMAELEREPALNVGGLFHGKIVDLDIDTNQPLLFEALDYFLPKTPYVWGRKSKPKSHRAYVLHEDFDRDVYGPLLRYLKALKIGDKSFSVEVRGGKPENGLFTVLPGSYRGDVEEEIEWDPSCDPTMTAPYIPTMALLRQIRLAMAAALIASYFGDGLRNDMSLAMAGLLWRIRSSSMATIGIDAEEDAPDDVFFLREDDAHHLFEAVLEIGDPNKADRRQRVLNFSNTWRKLEADAEAKVTGGRVMAELIGGDEGERVVRAVYRLLSDNDGIEALEALAEQFVVWYGQGVLIDCGMVAMGRVNPWMTKDQAINSLGNQKVKLGGKKIPVVNILFGSSLIKRVSGLTFDPSTTDRVVPTEEGPMVNQWRGFAQEPCPQQVSEEEVKPFLDYVREVLASNNDTAYRWVLGWIADMLQQPASKPGTALVLVGAHGAGKTFLGERILGRIIGKSHSTQMNSISQLTDKFNSIADNKVFIQCDEAVHSYQKDVAAKLKSLISDETLTIEPKNVNSFKKPNHIHFLFTSNEENTAIFIDPSPHERRFTVLKVSDKYAKDLDYWTHMRAWTQLNLHKIMRFLLDYKYDRSLIMRPVHTQAKRDIQRIGVEPEVSWITNRLSSGFILSPRTHEHWWQAYNSAAITKQDQEQNTLRRDVWPDRVYTPALEQDFRAFVREHGRSVYSGSILTTIKKALPPNSLETTTQVTVSYTDPRTNQMKKDRPRLTNFPAAEDILAHLRSKYGDIIDHLVEAAEVKDHIIVENDEPSEF